MKRVEDWTEENYKLDAYEAMCELLHAVKAERDVNHMATLIRVLDEHQHLLKHQTHLQKRCTELLERARTAERVVSLYVRREDMPNDVQFIEGEGWRIIPGEDP